MNAFTRRGFLSLAGAGTLLASPIRRILGHDVHPPQETRAAAASTGPLADPLAGPPAGPLTAPQPQAFSLTGGSDDVSFLAASQWDRTMIPDVQVGLLVAPSDDLADAIPYPAADVSAENGIVQHLIDGLTPNTRYWCQPWYDDGSGTPIGFGQVFQGVTRPADDGTAYSIDLILGSCLSNYGDLDGVPTPQVALADALAQVPEASVLLHLGDWGYWVKRSARPTRPTTSRTWTTTSPATRTSTRCGRCCMPPTSRACASRITRSS